VLTAAVLTGRLGMTVLFCVVTLLGFHEYLHLIPRRAPDRPIVAMLYPLLAANYVWVFLQQYALFAVFLPLVVLLLIFMGGVLKAQTRGFLNAMATLHLGVMLTGYCIAHAAALTMLPEELNPRGGAAGWVLFLIVLTAINDIAQSVWGRWIGRNKVTPRVSPGKTWEGLLAGVATTIVIALAMGPALLPVVEYLPEGGSVLSATGLLWTALAGLIIGIGGFFGDITMSAIKRDMGRKDSGTLLPGQGGILDRIDSVTFTAPLFYWYVRIVWGA